MFTLTQSLCAGLFALAVIHTFLTPYFERLAHSEPKHAGLWHLLGEVEVVFGFWALVMMVLLFALQGSKASLDYIDSRNFTEPLFVFAIMVMAATRPLLQTLTTLVLALSRTLPFPGSLALYALVLALIPLLGAFITEPAAMTLAALLLARHFYVKGISPRLQYATLGVLFVNVSIGGTLTAYAAPPVLMVASTWGWTSDFMFHTFGWKAALAVVVNSLVITAVFWQELARLQPQAKAPLQNPVPKALVLVQILLLLGVVVFAHHPAVFLGLFLLFLGIAQAYPQHQDRLILREALLVAFFLAGLVVLGGQQQSWLQPLLLSMDSQTVFWGATALTAITDNAALTYLGSLVPGLGDEFKYMLVAGAVTGGGLTLIANAPNPAGAALLRPYLPDQTVNPLKLLVAALAPTAVAVVAFLGL